MTRPENIWPVYESLRPAWDHLDVHWYIIHDCKVPPCMDIDWPHENPDVDLLHLTGPKGDAGWAQRNWHLCNGRKDAFIYWHDDDTLAVPDLFRDLKETVTKDPHIKAIVYAMKYPHKEGRMLVGNSSNVSIGTISGSMVVFHRSTVGDLRAKMERCADGQFFQQWWAQNHTKDHTLWTDKPYILYNSLNPERPE